MRKQLASRNSFVKMHWGDLPRDVLEVDLAGDNAVADGTVAEIDVVHALRRGALAPINHALVVVVQAG